jgi:hypothetical protein
LKAFFSPEVYTKIPYDDLLILPRQEPTSAEIENMQARRRMMRNGIWLVALLIIQLILLVVLIRSTLSL